MSLSRSRQFFTFLLVCGAVVFGMVLAGGMQMTPTAQGGPASVSAPLNYSGSSFPDFADLAAAVDPAVVSIRSTKFDKEGGPRSGNPFDFFLQPRPKRGAPQEEEPSEPRRSEAGGSGFVVSEDGLIVTNFHVIRGASEITVTLEEREFKAEVRGTDPSTDLALLKINAGHPLTYLRLGDSDALRVGEWVIAVGSPLDLSHSVTVGVVSAKGRAIGINDISFENFIQTDAAINFGNSGGPLLNVRGEVVGINTAINYEAENIGFAVPANTLKSILPQLRDTGKVRRGYLGINIRNLDWKAAQAYGLPTTEGAVVAQVLPGKPADKAGIHAEDIILKVDDRKVKTTRDLIDYVSSQGPTATVNLEVLREGKKMTLKVKLEEREAPNEGDTTPAKEGEEGGIDWLGLRYQDLSPSSREGHGLPDDLKGVLVTNVAATSPLYEEGLRNNDSIYVITAVNGQPVSSVAEFEKVVKKASSGSRLRLYIRTFSGRGEESGPILAYPSVP